MNAPRHLNAAADSVRYRLASDVVVAGGLAFVNGVLPVDLHNDRAPLPEMIEAQTQRVFENLDTMLAAAGIGGRHLLAVQVRLADMDRLVERFDRAWLRHLGEQPPPTRSCCGVQRITRGALVEMDFIVRAA